MAAEDEPQAHRKGNNRMSKKFPNGEIRIKPAKAAEIVGMDIEKDVVECKSCNETKIHIDPAAPRDSMLVMTSAVLESLGVSPKGRHAGITGKIIRILDDHAGAHVLVQWSDGSTQRMTISNLRKVERPKLKVGDKITTPEQMDDVPLEMVLHYRPDSHNYSQPNQFAMIRTGVNGWQKTDATNLYLNHANAKNASKGRPLTVLYVPDDYIIPKW